MSKKLLVSKKTPIIISCFYDSLDPTSLPVGFSWAQTLYQDYGQDYNITILLHGECIQFGLNNETYEEKYNTTNPYASFLADQVKNGTRIVICNLCLHNDGFNDKQLLPYVKPIQFSIDFIAQSQLRGSLVVYDAQLAKSTS
jgi:intracellular sulfur oxidation DsrE/DsrF family protein